MTALPPRSDEVLGRLPGSFRPSQVDYLPNSLCWYRDSWLASTNAWGDRRLARLGPDGAWTEFPAPAGWIRRPWTERGDHLCILHHAGNADHGTALALRDGVWEPVAEAVEEGTVTDWNGTAVTRRDDAGHASVWTADGSAVAVGGPGALVGPGWEIPIPAGATVTHLSPSPDREAVLVVARIGGRQQAHVFALRDGRPLSRNSLRHTLQPTSAWLDEKRVVVVRELWPRLVPLVWNWTTGELQEVWGRGTFGAVRSVATAPDGRCLTAVSTPYRAREIRHLDEMPDADSGQVRTVIVERGGQLLPCLVHEPATRCQGTAFYFPGGPHEPVWGEYAPLAEAMNALGWRVVRVNTRASGLREPAYRPQRPVRYGTDDVADACAVIDALSEGPAITLGMSYGAYLATRAGELSEHCQGVAVLSGFLHHDDIAETRHAGVKRFADFAWQAQPPQEPVRLTKRYFIAHGDQDRRIPLEAVERNRSRMETEPVFIRLDREGHALHTDRGARLTYPRLLRWLTDL